MPSNKKPQNRARSKPLPSANDNNPTRQILGSNGHEGESYTDIFSRLMALKPKTPIAGYRLPVLKKKSR